MSSWYVAMFVRDSLLVVPVVAERLLLLVVVFVVVVFVIGFEFQKARTLYGSSDSPSPEQLTNCPSCGSRIAIEADECEYCGEPLNSTSNR